MADVCFTSTNTTQSHPALLSEGPCGKYTFCRKSSAYTLKRSAGSSTAGLVVFVYTANDSKYANSRAVTVEVGEVAQVVASWERADAEAKRESWMKSQTGWEYVIAAPQ